MGSQAADEWIRSTSAANPDNVEKDLDYILAMFELIAHKAQTGYANEGRGAMIVDLTNMPEVNGGYLSLTRLLVELGDIPDQTLEETLQSYSPETEFVAVVRRADRSLHGYILSY